MSDVTQLLTAIERDDVPIVIENLSDDLLALDDALTRLAVEDPQAARLVQLRYFTGLTIPEAAESLGISARTADRSLNNQGTDVPRSPDP